jgi:hypothetical protein
LKIYGHLHELQIHGDSGQTPSGVTIGPAYKGCKAFGISAPITVNECHYTLSNVAESSPATATAAITCPEGKVITVKPIGLSCTSKSCPSQASNA